MAGYTKEEYDALYSIRVSRYFGGTVAGQQEVRCNYHKWAMAPILVNRWTVLAPILNIAANQRVCIIGAGFGWGVESFITETGCTTVGIDISDYIAAEKDNTEEVELRAAITAAGHDPDSGHGADCMAGIYDGLPRIPPGVIVLQEDASTNTSRNAIRSALGGWPSVCILEDIIDETTTDQEITQVNDACNLFAGQQRVIWITNGTAGRSLLDLQTLTGSEVISTDGSVHLGGP